MRYSEMSSSEQERILGNPYGYPLKVTFLGNTALLNFAAVELLRAQSVDFDVDDAQARRLLAGEGAGAGMGAGRNAPAPPVEPLYGQPSPLLLGLAAVAGALVIRRFLPWR